MFHPGNKRWSTQEIACMQAENTELIVTFCFIQTQVIDSDVKN